MKRKARLLILLLLTTALLTACGGSGENNGSGGGSIPPAQPNPTPTEAPPPIPTVAPIPGWLSYSGRGVHIWLPESFFGGNPAVDINILNQYLGQYGEVGQMVIDDLSPEIQNTLFFAFDTASSPDTLTTLSITVELIPTDTTMDTFLDSGLGNMPPEITLLSREQGSINGMDTARLVLETPAVTGGMMRSVIYAVRESTSQMYVLTFDTSLAEFDARAADFQQAIRTFRTDRMLSQSQAQPADDSSPTPTPAGLLFSDQFDNDLSGWAIQNNEIASIYFSESSYHFYIFDVGSLAWSALGDPYESVIVEVDTWADFGQPEATISEMGIICGFQDNSSFYYLAVRSDGHFSIMQMTAEGERLLGTQVWMFHPAINTGSTPNRLMAECTGHTLRLTVNGQLMEEAVAPTPVTGQVGLFASNFEGENAHAVFDNFLVRSP